MTKDPDWNDHAKEGVDAVREKVDQAAQSAAQRVPPKKWANARELQTKSFPPIRFVVPGYVAEGCTLLAGRPKIGKSWLMLEAGLAVATGAPCWGGIECEEGDVLYLALEDNERRLRRRITKLIGADHGEWPERFTYATEWPRLKEGGLEQIREWIRSAKNPHLIVIDVLAVARSPANNKQIYPDDYGTIRSLQQIALDTGVAIVVVAHVRKSQADTDPFEKVSGSYGLSGAADTVLVLDGSASGKTLYGRGRDIEEIESAIAFDSEACRWRVLGEDQEVRRSTERSKILSALREAGQSVTPTEIAAATGLPRNNVDQLLLKMVRAEEVAKPARGQYALPDLNEVTSDKTDKKVRMGSPRQSAASTVVDLTSYRSYGPNTESGPVSACDEAKPQEAPPSNNAVDVMKSKPDEIDLTIPDFLDRVKNPRAGDEVRPPT